MKDRVLIVAAHPDDEILGCGGTMARLAEDGAEILTLILGEGATSRDDERDRDKRLSEISTLKQNIKDANAVVGCHSVLSYDFPDNRFDSVPLLDIIKVIESVKKEFKPAILFTHYSDDMNIDHSITHRAVLTATRPMVDEIVKEVYAFEVLSSTEWKFPNTFSPDYFVSIESTLERKVQAMELYESELCDYPHPRSLKGIRLNAEYWGMRTGTKYSEAFKTIRRINR